MKILIDARLYGLENAGLGRYLINLIGELSKQDSQNEYIVLLRKKYFDDLKLPKNWEKVLADMRHYSFAEQIKIPKLIAEGNPDLTHFPHFNVPFFFKGDFIVTIHDMLMHKSIGLSATTLPAPLYFMKRLGYRIVFDNAVRKAKLILVPSFAVKSELIERYGLDDSKIKVTYEGVDRRIGRGALSNRQKPYFVYTGNAYPHKNLKNLIKAIKILNTKSQQIVFLFIGSARNIFTQRIEIAIRRLEAGKYVKLLGFVPDENLGSLHSNSVAFVFPSYSEGFGLPGLEALGSGTLLLASDIRVFKEIYKEHALYFDPGKPDSIARAMESALSMSEENRRKRILDSLQFVNKYSWDKMAKETLEAYVEGCNSIRQSK